MTTEEALGRYLAERGIVEEATTHDQWYAQGWIFLKIRGRRIPYFPIIGLKESVLLHDLNHLLSGCETNYWGEFEIAGWELASGGCGRHLYLWFDRAIYFLGGLVLAPRTTLRGWAHGWRRRNAYRLEPARALAMEIDELREYSCA